MSQYLLNKQLPLLAKGVPKFPQISQKKLVKNLLISQPEPFSYEITYWLFLAHLEKLFKGICENDFKAVEHVAEKSFKEELQKYHSKENQLTFEPFKDVKLQVVDELLVRGLSQERDRNDSNIDYKLLRDKEQEGLRVYQHNFFAGDYMYYFYPTLNKEESNDQIRQKFSEMKKERYECHDALIFKMIVLIEKPGVFKLNGEEIKEHEASHHALVFQNELQKTEDSHTLFKGSFSDWVNTHRLDQTKWKISEIDNYLQGQGLFSKQLDLDTYDEAKRDFMDSLNEEKEYHGSVKELLKTLGEELK